MEYKGSCHCGKIRYEVNADVEQCIECNCSHCYMKGYILFFTPQENVKITEGSLDDMSIYTFNKHAIKHYFCPNCGAAPFGMSKHDGKDMCAVNIRCLENFDKNSVKIVPVDGKSF